MSKKARRRKLTMRRPEMRKKQPNFGKFAASTAVSTAVAAAVGTMVARARTQDPVQVAARSAQKLQRAINRLPVDEHPGLKTVAEGASEFLAGLTDRLETASAPAHGMSGPTPV